MVADPNCYVDYQVLRERANAALDAALAVLHATTHASQMVG